MSDEKNLLEQVDEKEGELATRYDRACAETDAAREAVVRERQARLDQAAREAREVVETRRRCATTSLDDEIEQMRRRAIDRESEFRGRIEDRVPTAVSELVRLVVSGGINDAAEDGEHPGRRPPQ